ncbi:hypothetical protein NG796_06660 [Laspinema sp. A4]|uniref:hypothetical protein n=1 Tax=Laspinema sp. D2d TaxID=2953686 RepID=UPI0021BB5A21|nr:hypothetical protein [Laspinema sp. D2d]MCT7982971.1 hypothetical protein [Laspinema sp. D2d]
MVRKNSRFLIYIVACSTIGVLVGGAAYSADLNRCLDAAVPTNQCLTEDPVLNTLEGMTFGLIAGAGGALGATWQIWQKNK